MKVFLLAVLACVLSAVPKPVYGRVTPAAQVLLTEKLIEGDVRAIKARENLLARAMKTIPSVDSNIENRDEVDAQLTAIAQLVRSWGYRVSTTYTTLSDAYVSRKGSPLALALMLDDIGRVRHIPLEVVYWTGNDERLIVRFRYGRSENPQYRYLYLETLQIYDNFPSIRLHIPKHKKRELAAVGLVHVALEGEKRQQSVVSVIDRALAMASEHPHVTYHAAEYMSRRGEIARAEALYRKSLTQERHFTHAGKSLSILLARSGRYDDARQVLAGFRSAFSRVEYKSLEQEVSQLGCGIR